MYKLQINQKGPKKSPLRDIDFSLLINRTRLDISQNSASILGTALYYR